MPTIIQAAPRTKLRTSELRNLRRSGRLPGNIMGKNEASRMIHLSTVEFQRWLKQGASGFIDLQMEQGGSVTVLLEELQRDPVSRDLLHADFQLVQSGEVLRTKIPVKFTGTPKATKQGGIVQVQSAFIEVEALPKYLPQSLEYAIDDMDIGESVLVEDIALPPEVTLVSGSSECLVSVVKP